MVSGQLEGTLFDVETAQQVSVDTKGKPPLPDKAHGESGGKSGGDGNVTSARDAAQAARNASRVLQSLPSKVFHPHIWCC